MQITLESYASSVITFQTLLSKITYSFEHNVGT